MDEQAPAFAPAKLRAPSFAIALIERPKLTAALRSIPERALTLVTAPAGSGKTAGVAGWAATAELPVAWLRLEPSDVDPSRLLAALLAAVAVARPELTPASWPEPGPVAIDAWLTRRLLIPLAERGGSLVIVFDEAELEQSGPLAQALEFLLDNREPTLHLVVIGRTPPTLALARLEAAGELGRIGVDELWFEAEQLAALIGARVDAGPVAELERITRGWPVAAQLWWQAVRAGDRVPREAVDRRVLDYVIEQVIDRLPPPVRELLIATAILDELEPDACAAVSGQADAGERLWSAVDSGLLIGGREGLRAHPLLREALQRRLGDRKHERALHGRASRFYAQRGRIEAALEHGIAAGDVEGLAALARERGWTYLRAGQLDALTRLLAAVDAAGPIAEAHAEDQRAVAVLRAWAALGQGPAVARAALEQARAQVHEDMLLQRSLAALEALIELRSGQAVRGLELATAALDGLQADQRGLAVVLRLAVALARELGDDIAGALEALARAGQDAALAPALPSLATITGHRVRLLRRLARHGEALELGERTLARLGELGWEPAPATGMLLLELAMVELDRGRFDAAERLATQGLARVELGGDAAAHVRGLVGLARIRRALGDADGLAAALELAHARARAAQLGYLTALILIEEDPLALGPERLAMFGPLGRLLLGELRLARASAHLRAPDPTRRTELVAELEREREAADGEGRRLAAVETRVLLAALVREPERARELLEQAEAIAEPEDLRGPFLREREQLRSLAPALPSWVASWLRGDTDQPEPNAAEPLLSERELELLDVIARGLSNQLIARELHISLATVKTHVHHILAKLEVRNRTQAVHRARALGLLG